jgi:hypothetical protein
MGGDVAQRQVFAVDFRHQQKRLLEFIFTWRLRPNARLGICRGVGLHYSTVPQVTSMMAFLDWLVEQWWWWTWILFIEFALISIVVCAILGKFVSAMNPIREDSYEERHIHRPTS